MDFDAENRSTPLTWMPRVKIALGASRGLNYLGSILNVEYISWEILGLQDHHLNQTNPQSTGLMGLLDTQLRNM